MNNDSTLCVDQSLLANLNSDDFEFAESELLEHVEECSQCQSRLRMAAADEGTWRKATSALQKNRIDEDCADDWFDKAKLGPWKNSPIAWDEAMVKQILDPPTHPEMLGRLGRYEIERLIGTGGMGLVFKAYDTELNRPVAMKLLAPYLAANYSARQRFAREARAAAGVVDDHVVPIHNVESENDPPFLVMQFIAGGSLQEKLDRDGPLDVTEILRIGLQTAKGLAAAHAQGLIHRDIKPSNILLDEGVERALLTDFGLARAENDASLTHSGFHPGTPDYMSPEQVRGEPIDCRSDLFGLGCVLYALGTGHPPFKADTSFAVMRRITEHTSTPICEINPDVPEWLSKIIFRLLEKDVELRFQSAHEVAELLERCLAHVQQPTIVPVPENLTENQNTHSHLGSHSIGRSYNKAVIGITILFAFFLAVFAFTNKKTFNGFLGNQQDSDEELSEKLKIILHRQKGKQLKVYLNSRGAYVNGRSVNSNELNLIVEKSGLKTAVVSAESYVGEEKIATWEKTLREAGIKSLSHAKPLPKESDQEKIDRIIAQQKGNDLRVYLKGTRTVYVNGTQVSLSILKQVIRKSKSKTVGLASALEVLPSRLDEIEKWLKDNGVKSVKRGGNAAQDLTLKEVVEKSKEKARKDRESNLRTIASRQKGDTLKLYLSNKGGYINGRSVSVDDLTEFVKVTDLKKSTINAEPYLDDKKIDAWKDALNQAGVKKVEIVRLRIK